MHTSDWLPTLYEAAGGNVSDLGHIDGVSLWQTLTSIEPSVPRREFIYNIDDLYNNSAVRYGSWKLIQGNTSTSDLGGGIWDGWYGNYVSNCSVQDLIPKILASEVATALETIGNRLNPKNLMTLQQAAQVNCSNSQISCDPYSGPCLFDLANDPCEQNNLANEEKEVVKHMLDVIKSYNETVHGIIDLSHHPEAAPQFWRYVWTNWKDYAN